MGGSLHGEVQCIMGNGHMRTPLEQNDRHTHVTILPSHCRGITQIHRSPSRLRDTPTPTTTLANGKDDRNEVKL